MNKKIISIIMALVMVLSLGINAVAEDNSKDYGLIFDETGIVNENILTELNDEVLPNLIEKVGADIRIDILSTEGMEKKDAYFWADDFYNYYGYGYGEDMRGVTLTILATPTEDGGYYIEYSNWYTYVGGTDSEFKSVEFEGALMNAVSPYMMDGSADFGAVLTSEMMIQTIYSMLGTIAEFNGVEFYASENAGPDEELSEEYEGGFVGEYIYDMAGMLNYNEFARLEAFAANTANTSGCGVYVITLSNYDDCVATTADEAINEIYYSTELPFGIGEDANGIMLLLAESDRSWAMLVNGEDADKAFDSKTQSKLTDAFLDNLKEDDWYGGIEEYVYGCGKYLAQGADGSETKDDSEEESPIGGMIIAVAVSCIVALLVCLVLKGKMNSVHRNTEANAYLGGGLILNDSYERYTHTTETRRQINQDSGKDDNKN